MGTPVATPSISISRLRSKLKGRVITPQDADYDAVRIGISRDSVRRPALIVRAMDSNDVAHVVTLANEAGMELAIRSGGHSLAGFSTSEGGIVLDLSQMKVMDIDVSDRTVWAETGLTAGEFTNEMAKYGLATGFGDAASVGIGGLTTGGGIGFLVRKYGMTIDNVLAAEVVTADGRIRYVDANNDPDLFWAIRGGGSNFGIVTKFKFRLHPVNIIVGGILVLPAQADVLAAFAAQAEAAPDELSTIVNVMPAPPLPFIPPQFHGQLVALALLVYTGDVEEGLRVVAPFRKLAEPIVDLINPMPYPAMYLPEDPNHIAAAAIRSKFINQIDERTAQIMLDQLNSSDAPVRIAQFRVLGGAMARVPADATAFALRSSRAMVNFIVEYANRDEADIHSAWASKALAALEQDAGVYVNFVANEGQARVHQAYPDATFERLAEIKAKYDPTNFFRRNHNIAPKAK
ncbi:MAG: FAD-binding oxidoreductase [Anaerolineae bacterium]|nr:FAD-binding oxidoreductase [Anaerolineae bacterium]